MPITKQATKRMRQNYSARGRNRHYVSQMKSLIKLMLGYVQKGDMEKAKKTLPLVTKAIDMAAKKNLIHGKNASHKKSRIQKALNVAAKK